MWEAGDLVDGWYGDAYPGAHGWAVFDVLVIEVPQIYSLRQSKGGLKGQNDLIDLAVSAGEVIGVHRTQSTEIVIYRPREWKGQVPKEVMTRRIKGKVDEEERARLDLPRAESKHHNVWDGVGIGLKYWGRL